jgi:predicted nucleic acid-binding protein
MPKYLEKIYLDTSVIIAWLKNESLPNNEMEGVEYCMDRIMKGEIKAITASITRTEILEGKFPTGTVDNFLNYFSRRRSFEWIAVGNRISDIAHDIRDYLSSINKKLAVPDATHLATAIYESVDALYTFDKDHLLPLDGVDIAGYRMKICKPPLPKQGSFKF